MLTRKITAAVCFSAALVLGASTQVSAQPVSGSGLAPSAPLAVDTYDAARHIVPAGGFGFGFRFGDRDRDHWRWRHHRRWNRDRSYGPSFTLRIPTPSYRSTNSCSYWSQRCTDNWGYGGSNYYGCMRYYGCT